MIRDIAGYAFLFCLFAVVGLRFLPPESETSWAGFGRLLIFFTSAAILARWAVLAFKKRVALTAEGQRIVGVELPQAETVLDVLDPQTLKRELKKPKLRKRF